jgi:hypothetical protein
MHRAGYDYPQAGALLAIYPVLLLSYGMTLAKLNNGYSHANCQSGFIGITESPLRFVRFLPRDEAKARIDVGRCQPPGTLPMLRQEKWARPSNSQECLVFDPSGAH